MLRKLLCLMLIITLVQISFSQDSRASSSEEMKAVQEMPSHNGETGKPGPDDFNKALFAKGSVKRISGLYFSLNIQQNRTNRQEQSFLLAVFYQSNYFRHN